MNWEVTIGPLPSPDSFPKNTHPDFSFPRTRFAPAARHTARVAAITTAPSSPARKRRRALLLLALPAAVLLANWWLIHSSATRIIADLDQLPANDVAIVLGTSPTIEHGRYRNPFFERRMDAAARLYHAGKVRHLLLSGDNGRKDYDEPAWMRDALLARGVPAAALTLDCAGFRTLDTMARARAVFGQTKVTLVTDDFHLPRALFLARVHGLDAVGFPSAHVPDAWSKTTRLREVGSRVKACLDIYVLRTQPKFYGPPVVIDLAAR